MIPNDRNSYITIIHDLKTCEAYVLSTVARYICTCMVSARVGGNIGARYFQCNIGCRRVRVVEYACRWI